MSRLIMSFAYPQNEGTSAERRFCGCKLRVLSVLSSFRYGIVVMAIFAQFSVQCLDFTLQG